jgi:hypothetical protein
LGFGVRVRVRDSDPHSHTHSPYLRVGLLSQMRGKGSRDISRVRNGHEHRWIASECLWRRVPAASMVVLLLLLLLVVMMMMLLIRTVLVAVAFLHVVGRVIRIRRAIFIVVRVALAMHAFLDDATNCPHGFGNSVSSVRMDICIVAKCQRNK